MAPKVTGSSPVGHPNPPRFHARSKTAAFELRHRTLDYRLAQHHHDEEHFVRQYQVATHEHCESTMRSAACGHYFGFPVQSAIDGMTRPYRCGSRLGQRRRSNSLATGMIGAARRLARWHPAGE